MKKPLSPRLASLLLVLPLASLSCAPAAPAPKTAAGPIGISGVAKPTGAPSDELHWLRNSAEYRAITIETYRAALASARTLSAGLPAGSWGVSVDADETVLDNSTYEVELQRRGEVHSDAAWKAWVARRERNAVPGAATFLSGVRALGGRVAVVTNTAQSLCPDVAANLEKAGLPYDLLVCRADDGGDRKEGRWKAIEAGTALPGVAPVKLLLWVGDNIQDFPDQSQALREKDESAFADFGVRFFALPNPVYGTWEKNAPR